MTCYFRYLRDIFERASVEVTKENKREIDKVFNEIVGVKYKDCPATWREVKKLIAEDEASFVFELSKKWSMRARAV